MAKSLLPITVLLSLLLLTTAQANRAALRLGTVAYVHNGAVWIKELPDGRAQRLTQDRSAGEPKWSATGTWLTFTTGADNGPGQVWAVRRNGTGLHEITEGDDAAWSPKSDVLAYYRNGNLCMTVPGVWRERKLVDASRIGNVSLERLAWSPDGRWIAYGRTSITPDGWHCTLWRVGIDGKGTKKLFDPHKVSEDQPELARWTPDGRHILFWRDFFTPAESLNSDGVPFWEVSSNGGKARRLTAGKRDGKLHPYMLRRQDFLTFAPDGRNLAIAEGGSRFVIETKRIVRIDSVTGKRKRLTDRSVAASSPAWSPNGRQIAYVAVREDDSRSRRSDDLFVMKRYRLLRLYLMNADGSGTHRVTHSEGYSEQSPVWCADGRHLLFIREDAQEVKSLWLVGSDGSGLRKIAAGINETRDRADFALWTGAWAGK